MSCCVAAGRGCVLAISFGPSSPRLIPSSGNFLCLFFEHHPQQQASPGAVGTPVFGDLPSLLDCREVIQTVGQGDGATQSRFVRGQSIWLACSTQENELSGKVTDTREGLQVLKRLFWRQRTQRKLRKRFCNMPCNKAWMQFGCTTARESS